MLFRSVAKIESYQKDDHPVFFTRDTHGEEYLETQEGKLLPVPHCIKGTEGWQLVDQLKVLAVEEDVLDKPVFGSLQQMCIRDRFISSSRMPPRVCMSFFVR